MKTVLIVGDEPAARQLYRDALEGEAYCVLEAHEADTALWLLRTATVDLAVLDIPTARSLGLELLDAIHRSWPALPVVLCSGTSQIFDDYVVWRASTQVAGIFCKPVDMRALLDSVRLAFDGTPWSRERPLPRPQDVSLGAAEAACKEHP